MTSLISNFLFGNKDKKENENAELAMREALDERDEYKVDEQGIMDFDDYIYLRSVITRQAMR